MRGCGATWVGVRSCERPEARFRRFSGHRRGRVSPRPPGAGRNPPPGAAPGRGAQPPGGLPSRRGVPPAADQPDHPAPILRPGRASRRETSQSARPRFLSGRRPSPHPSRRAGGLAGAESGVSARRSINPSRVPRAPRRSPPARREPVAAPPRKKNPWYSRRPRARVFSFCPAYPRRQGGAGYPCPRLAAGRIHAPRSALSPWPLAGRFVGRSRRAAGAGSAGSGVAGSCGVSRGAFSCGGAAGAVRGAAVAVARAGLGSGRLGGRLGAGRGWAGPVGSGRAGLAVAGAAGAGLSGAGVGRSAGRPALGPNLCRPWRPQRPTVHPPREPRPHPNPCPPWPVAPLPAALNPHQPPQPPQSTRLLLTQRQF